MVKVKIVMTNCFLLVMNYYCRSVYATTVSTQTLCMWSRINRGLALLENGLITCIKSDAFFFLFFFSYEQKNAGKGFCFVMK